MDRNDVFARCAHCLVSVHVVSLEAHQERCTRNVASCEGCGATVPMRHFRQHLSTCPALRLRSSPPPSVAIAGAAVATPLREGSPRAIRAGATTASAGSGVLWDVFARAVASSPVPHGAVPDAVRTGLTPAQAATPLRRTAGWSAAVPSTPPPTTTTTRTPHAMLTSATPPPLLPSSAAKPLVAPPWMAAASPAFASSPPQLQQQQQQQQEAAVPSFLRSSATSSFEASGAATSPLPVTPLLLAPESDALPMMCQECGRLATTRHVCPRRRAVAPCPHCGESVDARFVAHHLTACVRRHLATSKWADPEGSMPVRFDRSDASTSSGAAAGNVVTPLRVDPLMTEERLLSQQTSAPLSPSVAATPAPAAAASASLDQPATARLPPTHRLCVLCQDVIRRDEQMSHLDTCRGNLRSCPHCGAGTPVHIFEDHVMSCARNTRECHICRRRVTLVALPEHVSGCCQRGLNGARGVGGALCTMFHGTTVENARSIVVEGFRPSTSGLLGAGVYLSRDVAKAAKYGPAVIEAHVDVGKVLVVNRRGHPHQKNWRVHGFDSAWIPAHCGLAAAGLEEHCVADPRRVAIVRLVPPREVAVIVEGTGAYDSGAAGAAGAESSDSEVDATSAVLPSSSLTPRPKAALEKRGTPGASAVLAEAAAVPFRGRTPGTPQGLSGSSPATPPPVAFSALPRW